MSEQSDEDVPAEYQHAFDQIWTQLPDRQNRHSSSWWFFILFPEGEEGYGPKQLMFTVSMRVGERLRVNEKWTPGPDPNRTVEDGIDEFPVMVVGWSGDDQQVHDHLLNESADATLSTEGSLTAWNDDDCGAEIRSADGDRPGLTAAFTSEDCHAEFEAYGDLDQPISSPVVAKDIETPLGGTHLVAWRRMQFSGEFDLPDGREHLEGLCYFQRVCLNVPLFPWKWVWIVFPDGSAFSVMIPFVGPQLFRKGYQFFSSEAAERATIPVQQSGMWEWGDSGERTQFDSVSVTPVLEGDDHPDFVVEASTDDGDYVKFLASSYGHARNYIDRPRLGGRVETHWSYNEYLVQVEGLEGNVGGETIDGERMGEGFGTLEYAWGMGL